MKHHECGALHFEILHAIPGRIRIHLEKPVASERLFAGAEGVKKCRYNPRIRTLLCEYDPERVDEDALIERLGAVYAGAVGTELLHVRRLGDLRAGRRCRGRLDGRRRDVLQVQALWGDSLRRPHHPHRSIRWEWRQQQGGK